MLVPPSAPAETLHTLVGNYLSHHFSHKLFSSSSWSNSVHSIPWSSHALCSCCPQGLPCPALATTSSVPTYNSPDITPRHDFHSAFHYYYCYCYYYCWLTGLFPSGLQYLGNNMFCSSWHLPQISHKMLLCLLVTQ